MSGRKKAPMDSGNDIEITVIRSADDKRSQISISPSSTLNTLKDAINSDQTLGPIKREQQRLFHLGRELKSGNRSLSTLGIGKHNVFSIHLHSLAPKTVDLQSDDENDVGKRVVKRRSKNAAKNNDAGDDGVIDLAGSESSPADGGRLRNNSTRQQRNRQHQQQREEQEKVVELLDSDSDDDDDVVEIVETPPKRRRS